MYTRESIELLKQSIDLKEVLITFGGVAPASITDTGDELRCPCPLHGGDNKTAFSWKKSTRNWVCFSHGCGEETVSHDLFGFLKLKLGINFIQAVELLARSFGIILEKGDITSENKYNFSKESIKQNNLLEKYKVNELKELSWLPGYYQDGFEYILKYLESRNYNYNDLKVFNLYPCLDFLNTLRLGIPVYDENNKLVGINARLMDTIMDYPKTIDYENKTYPVPKYRMSTFPKGSILYNLNNAKDYSVKNGLIIVEGQLDVTRLHTYGIFNSVCTMGTTLSNAQVTLLYKHCYHIIFLIEEGEPALNGVIRSIKQLKGGMKVSIAKLPSGDADSNSKEQVLDTLASAKILTIKEVKDLCEGHILI
jgi:DNA primase